MGANQTSFKPGQIPNPTGRPKAEWTMRGLIQEALEEQDETGTPYKKLIAKKLAKLAASGEIVAIKEVNNRIDGMPQQDITSAGEKLEAPHITLDTKPHEETEQ